MTSMRAMQSWHHCVNSVDKLGNRSYIEAPRSQSNTTKYGAWLSPARALGSGPRGREFESPRPDNKKGNNNVVPFFRLMWTVAGSNR